MVLIKNIPLEESFVDSINENGLAVSLVKANSPAEKIFSEISQKYDPKSHNLGIAKFDLQNESLW